jgi:hypothetical protein
MNNENAEFDEKYLRGIMNDLKQYQSEMDASSEPFPGEMFDLLIDQAIKGVDIRVKFPELFRNLLNSKTLREQFMDSLSLLSPELRSIHDPYLDRSKLDLSFLYQNHPNLSSWPIFLAKSRHELSQLFFPAQTVYREVIDPGAKPIYSLLRKDFSLAGVVYTVLIESTLSADQTDALSANLFLTSDAEDLPTAFPIQASIHWGDYATEITLNNEGKCPLPDIPLRQVFDSEITTVKSDFYLTLSSATH